MLAQVLPLQHERRLETYYHSLTLQCTEKEEPKVGWFDLFRRADDILNRTEKIIARAKKLRQDVRVSSYNSHSIWLVTSRNTQESSAAILVDASVADSGNVDVVYKCVETGYSDFLDEETLMKLWGIESFESVEMIPLLGRAVSNALEHFSSEITDVFPESQRLPRIAQLLIPRPGVAAQSVLLQQQQEKFLQHSGLTKSLAQVDRVLEETKRVPRRRATMIPTRT